MTDQLYIEDIQPWQIEHLRAAQARTGFTFEGPLPPPPARIDPSVLKKLARRERVLVQTLENFAWQGVIPFNDEASIPTIVAAAQDFSEYPILFVDQTETSWADEIAHSGITTVGPHDDYFDISDLRRDHLLIYRTTSLYDPIPAIASMEFARRIYLVGTNLEDAGNTHRLLTRAIMSMFPGIQYTEIMGKLKSEATMMAYKCIPYYDSGMTPRARSQGLLSS